MDKSTKPTPQERKEATANLKKKHQPYFDSCGKADAAFIPKMAHYVKDLEGLHMGFFSNELDHGGDVYTEMVSKHIESEDPDRVLYHIRYNPHFEEEYAKSEPMSNGSVRYYIPVSEMNVVDKTVTTVIDVSEFNLMNPDEDMPLDQMTVRDVAALLLKVPVSKKKWLNEIIKQAK